MMSKVKFFKVPKNVEVCTLFRESVCFCIYFAIQVMNVVTIVAGEENLLGEPSYKYLTADEMRGLGDDSMAIDVTHDEKQRAEVDGGGKGALPPSSVSATMVSERGRVCVCLSHT